MDLSGLSDSDLMNLAQSQGTPMDAPQSVANNNPGNMRGGDGGFQKFDTPKAGLDAMQNDLMLKVNGQSPVMKSKYGDGYQPTLRNVISTWAPDSENDTANYVNFVSKHSGLDPDAALSPQDVPKIMQPMVHMEGGQKAASYFGKLMDGVGGMIIPPAQASDGGDLTLMSNEDLMKLAQAHGVTSNENTEISPQNADGTTPGGATPVDNWWNNTKENFGGALENTKQALTEPLNNPNAADGLKVTDAFVRSLGKVGNAIGGAYGMATSPITAAFEAGVEPTIKPIAKGFEGLINDPRFKASNVSDEKAHGVAQDIGGNLTNALMLALSARNPNSANVNGGSGPPPPNPPGGGPPDPGGIVGFLKNESGIPGEFKTSAPTPPPAEAFKIGDEPNAPPLIATKGDFNKGMEDIKPFLENDGIDLNKVADDLEAAQKINPHITALDVMAKGDGDIPGGSNMVGLAKSIAQSPGQGRSMAAQMVNRGYIASGRIGDTFNKSISSSPYYNVKNDAIQQMEGTGDMYQKAFQANQNMNTPTINRLLNTPAGNSALKSAAITMQNDRSLVGVSNPDLVEQAALSGNPSNTGVGIADGLKMRTLHYVKQELWDLAQNERDPKTMKYTANGRAILGLHSDLLKEMNANDATRIPNKPNSGLYAQANTTYATPARVTSALEKGRGFMKLDPEEIQSFIADKNISNPEKVAFATGVRRALQDRVDNQQETTNPINSLWRPNLQKRIQPLFPTKQAYEDFASNMEHEKTMARVNNIVQGSPTYQNQAFSKNPIKTPIGSALRFAGNAMEPGMYVGKLGDFIDNALQGRANEMSQNSKTVIMRYLTTKNPELVRDLASRIKK